MANVTLNEQHLTDIANAIRTKKGTINKIYPKDMATEISSIQINTGGGGLDTSDATASSGDIANGKTAYVGGIKITGTLPDKANWNGAITNLNSVTVPKGIHNGYGKVEISPTEKSKIIPQNIKAGINILGVYGTHQSSGGGVNTSDATAVAENILNGKTAYTNVGKVTGTMPDNSNNGAIEIVSRDSMVKIPKGYYDGAKVYAYIATDSYNKLIPANIKSGVTILGVTGSYEGGAGGGSLVKTGRTSSQTINTGLSNISHFIMYTDRIYSIGVTSLAYDANKNECSLTFCGEYSAYSKYCNTVIKQPFMVSGGDIVWTETMQEYSYMAGATYNWIAIGS